MNALEAVVPFAERIAERNDVQIIGGLGAFALTRPDVYIDPERREVQLPRDSYLSETRENGSTRDIDILIMSAADRDLRAIDTLAKESMGHRLKVSSFPIHAPRRRPHTPLSIQVVSDRYFSAEGNGIERILSPFRVPLHPGSLEPWHLVSGDIRYPVAHPISVVMNYASRSIGGLRSKDIEKVYQAVSMLHESYSGFEDELRSEAFADQVEFARVVASLRGVPPHPALQFGDTVYSENELLEHPAFILRESKAPDAYKRAVLGSAALRAQLMNGLESMQPVVDAWQRLGIEETLASFIVKNK